MTIRLGENRDDRTPFAQPRGRPQRSEFPRRPQRGSSHGRWNDAWRGTALRQRRRGIGQRRPRPRYRPQRRRDDHRHFGSQGPRRRQLAARAGPGSGRAGFRPARHRFPGQRSEEGNSGCRSARCRTASRWDGAEGSWQSGIRKRPGEHPADERHHHSRCAPRRRQQRQAAAGRCSRRPGGACRPHRIRKRFVGSFDRDVLRRFAVPLGRHYALRLGLHRLRPLRLRQVRSLDRRIHHFRPFRRHEGSLLAGAAW